MASASIPAPLGEPKDPNSISGLSDAEAVRKAHVRGEAYVKAVGRVNDFHALFFGIGAFFYIRYTVLHLMGRITAPWTVKPGWIAYQADLLLAAVLALIAGCGLRRMRSWGFSLELLFLYSFALVWPLAILASSKPISFDEFAAGVALMSALAAPLLDLVDIRRSIVLTPVYRRVIEATPGVRVRSKLPWALRVSSAVLFVVFLGMISRIAANEVP
jgi:hypothetical protein